MGLKEMMANKMMGNMSPEEKQAMMNSMMEKFLADLTPEEKQKMMGDMMSKFMGNMSPEGMQGMMKSMMGGGGPMGMMMGMMGTRSGEKKDGEPGDMPWDMCKKMMASMTKTSELATFATPEVRGLFEEWATQIEEEILQFVNQSGSNDAVKIGEHFKLSTDSVTYFITRLANKGKINLKAEKNQ